MLILAAALSGAAAAQSPPPNKPMPGFRDIPLDAGLAASKAESKPLLLFFDADFSIASRRFAFTTLRDPQVLKLLSERVIAVRVDAAKQRDLCDRYRVDNVPMLLLLNDEGRETDCLMAFGRPKEMIAALEAALRGEDAEARARKLVAEFGEKDPLAREQLASALDRKRDFPAALREYLWCFDEGFKDIRYAAVRRDALINALASLGRDYPPADRALRDRRQEYTKLLLGDSDDPHLARTLAALNRALDDEPATLALLDKLPAESRRRRVLLEQALDVLVAQGRYELVAETIDPMRDFRSKVQLARLSGIGCCSVHSRRGTGSTQTVVERGAALVEVLAATARDQEARDLIAMVLAFEENDENRARLKQALIRAKRPELVEAVDAVPAAPPKPDLPGLGLP